MKIDAAAKMSAAPALPAAGLKCLILDFDSTISTPTYLQRAQEWAVADNVALFQSMSKEEVIANFGGPARIALDLAVVSPLQRRYLVEAGLISRAAAAAYRPPRPSQPFRSASRWSTVRHLSRSLVYSAVSSWN